MGSSYSNIVLKKALHAKKDEFYTQMCSIEKEICFYKDHLKNSIIFCNCDNPKESNFYKYFAENFESLGLKKLIATYITQEKSSYKYEIENNKETITSLEGNGDFRTAECIEILQEADIIITNPPFSLFREYIDQLMQYQKKFLIIGNLNAVTYKEVFQYIKKDEIWLGQSIRNGDTEFRVPDEYPLASPKSRIDKNGNKYIRVTGVRWFTNMEYRQRHKPLALYKKYSENEYKKYDNYNAINIDVTKHIPMDYNGEMGVPITFIDKYSPDQFEIVALGNSRHNFTATKQYINPKKILKDGMVKGGNAINNVLAFETSEKPKDTVFYISENSKYLTAPYARIIIKKREEKSV